MKAPTTFPIARWFGSHAVPDLKQIPRDQWREALRSVRSAQARRVALDEAGPLWGEAVQELFHLETEEWERRRAAEERTERPQPLPVPPAPRAQGRAGRQVNFRLADRDHADLKRASSVLGLRSATLARLLTLRGVAQVLAEHDEP